MLNDICIENLRELKHVLLDLEDDAYATSFDLLSNASIGQHVRHVLEFYLCLLNQVEGGVVNYDKRMRDHALESSTSNAVSTIDHIVHRLDALRENCPVDLVGEHGSESIQPFSVPSNVQRELAFNLEHAIHHQALIKIGLRMLGMATESGFGVASSTMRHTAMSVQEPT